MTLTIALELSKRADGYMARADDLEIAVLLESGSIKVKDTGGGGYVIARWVIVPSSRRYNARGAAARRWQVRAEARALRELNRVPETRL